MGNSKLVGKWESHLMAEMDVALVLRAEEILVNEIDVLEDEAERRIAWEVYKRIVNTGTIASQAAGVSLRLERDLVLHG